MIIPLNVDKNEDKELISWLNSKRNRSSFIRQVLCFYKNHIENKDDNILYLDVYKSEKPNSNIDNKEDMSEKFKTNENSVKEKDESLDKVIKEEGINKEDSEVLDFLIDGINSL